MTLAVSGNTPVWDDHPWTHLPARSGDVSADVCVVGLGGSGLTAVGELLRRGASGGGVDAGKVAGGGYGEGADKSEPVEGGRAELAMLADVLGWCQLAKPEPLDDVYPQSWRTSKQLTHPVGWLALDLDVRNV